MKRYIVSLFLFSGYCTYTNAMNGTACYPPVDAATDYYSSESKLGYYESYDDPMAFFAKSAEDSDKAFVQTGFCPLSHRLLKTLATRQFVSASPAWHTPEEELNRICRSNISNFDVLPPDIRLVTLKKLDDLLHKKDTAQLSEDAAKNEWVDYCTNVTSLKVQPSARQAVWHDLNRNEEAEDTNLYKKAIKNAASKHRSMHAIQAMSAE